MKILTASLTKPGGRKYNEDALCFDEQAARAFAALADGLGGHRGGRIASAIAVETAQITFWQQGEGLHRLQESLLETCARQANGALQQQQQDDPSLGRMKTTLVLWACDSDQAVWGHVGDSRLYHFREGVLVSRTKDDSLPQKLADIGEISEDAIRHHEDRNRLTAVLDGGEALRWHAARVSISPGGQDAFLLCSDGFWELVTEAEMTAFLASAPSPEAWLKSMENSLLEQAPSDHDNYSALAVWMR
ncbi:PP2C family protein-serine/threonine phosphatase [Anoxynatronum buryatiense]|uniref:Serine/threonine protein phosphatase PrpC n=1 Tax=Anoxynatronum buryatiense TaxID=489973 RepID=A0AA46AJS9_9CLOT|nr:protein phosphatase 2C domain-containing protein [Anoxynatronum buryatiense]SMP65255.1 Serine/threonine protein phosphatase PrpC [Anoxynatronum buryatiense]